jgi:hypothetical protein
MGGCLGRSGQNPTPRPTNLEHHMTLSISSARDRRGERYGHLFEDASSGVPRSLFWNLSLPCAPMEEGECAVLCEWLQWPVGEPEWDRFDTCSEPNPSGHSTVQPTLRSGPTGCFGARRTTGMGPKRSSALLRSSHSLSGCAQPESGRSAAGSSERWQSWALGAGRRFTTQPWFCVSIAMSPIAPQ